jgi:RNA polymerase sigma factor (sigma-70 family)
MTGLKSARKLRGKENHAAGYRFEDRVAEAYRLLGYRVEHGRIFSGRQVDIYLELLLGDLRVRRAIECKAGEVKAEDLDDFLLKLQLVQREFPDARGTVVSGIGFTDAVTSHASATGVQLTSYRDLFAQILDGPSYAQRLLSEIEHNTRYVPQLFVEPLIGAESSGSVSLAFEYLHTWLKDSRWNQLTLLGDVGTGKSFLCRMLARDLAQKYLENPSENPLPILIDLRNADREFSLEGLIITHFANHGLNRATFEVFQFLISEGRIVLLLDGFDEMAAKVTPNITTRNFHELARSVKQNAKVLLTCRTHYFKSRTEEEEVVLGGPEKSMSDVARDLYWDLISRTGFKIAYLRSFSLAQIEQYIKNTCRDDSGAVLKKIYGIYNLAELSQRPLLLEMIVKSVDRFTASEISSAQLYEIFTNAWIHRDRWRDVMRPEEKLKFVTALSRSLWEQELATIDYKKLEEYVGSELAALIDEPKNLVEIDAEVRTASFLTRDDQGRYGFAHTSYGEYFLAKDLASQLMLDNVKCLTIRRLTSEIIDFLLQMLDVQQLEKALVTVVQEQYQSLLSENALLLLYRLRRKLVIGERARGVDSDQLKIELPNNIQMQGAKLPQVTLEGAILHGARFEGADLRESIAPGASLNGACLERAIATKADFHGASFSNVNAASALFSEANFQGADLGGCNFSHADLSGSLLTARNWQTAIFSEAQMDAATFPAGMENYVKASLTAPLTESTKSTSDEALRKVFQIARGIAKRHGDDFDADDVASETVVYILSRPAEMTRLRELQGGGLIAYVMRVATGILAPILRERQKFLSLAPLENRSEEDFHEAESEGGDVLLDLDPIEMYEPAYAVDSYNVNTADLIMETLESREVDPSQFDLFKTLKGELTEEACQLLFARYIEEMSVAEIARKEQLTEVQVARRLHKARELAREVLLARTSFS